MPQDYGHNLADRQNFPFFYMGLRILSCDFPQIVACPETRWRGSGFILSGVDGPATPPGRPVEGVRRRLASCGHLAVWANGLFCGKDG
jgi:hypothetical protein